jgi:hypothetical protein
MDAVVTSFGYDVFLHLPRTVLYSINPSQDKAHNAPSTQQTLLNTVNEPAPSQNVGTNERATSPMAPQTSHNGLNFLSMSFFVLRTIAYANRRFFTKSKNKPRHLGLLNWYSTSA